MLLLAFFADYDQVWGLEAIRSDAGPVDTTSSSVFGPQCGLGKQSWNGQ